MSHQRTPAEEVKRLLREAGIEVPQAVPPTRPPRGPIARFARRLRRGLGKLLLCFLAAIVALFLWALGIAGDPPGPHASGHDARFGVVEAFRDPEHAALLNVGWERMVFWWKDLQKQGPDSWDPFVTGHDVTINAEVAAGRHLVGLLINTPDWAAANRNAHGASPPSGLYRPYDDPQNYWGHFVGLIAKRYAGRIDDWIIWNEVSIPSGHWRTWQGSTADYAQLVKIAYLAAKATNPHAHIILGGDPYWYDHGASFTDLLRHLTADPAAKQHNDYFDMANLHLYSRPTDVLTVVPWYRATMAHFGLHKPIWIGETNAIPYNDWLRHYPRGRFFVTLDVQASFIIQAFAIDLALGIDAIEVNRMIDGSDFAAGGEPFGLVRNDSTVRPAFYAYRTVVNLFSGVMGGTVHVDRATGITTVILRRRDAIVTVLWNQHPAAVEATIVAHTSSVTVYDKFGQRSLLHAHGGRYTVTLQGATSNTNSADPSDYVVGGNPLIVVQPA